MIIVITLHVNTLEILFKKSVDVGGGVESVGG
jgi:hypothetical protein